MTQEGTHKISLDRLLECGVILNWEALMQTATSSIQVDYRRGLDLSLEYLRLWTSTSRGTWNLLGAYWRNVSVSHAGGLIFEDGYESAPLREILQFAMQHPEAFLSLPGRSSNGLLRIQAPTKQEALAAATWMANSCHAGLTPEVMAHPSNGQNEPALIRA